MKLEHEFTVVAPIDETWDALLDVERVAGCLPGATVTPAAEEGVYDGQMKLKLGPMTVAYKGTLRMDEVDKAAHRAVMRIQAKELKGQGGATARMDNRLEPDGDGRTRVVVGTELDVSGRAAQLGRGMMENVAERLLADFAKRLERELAASRGNRDAPAAAGQADAGQVPSADAEPAIAQAPQAEPASTIPPAEAEALDLGALGSAVLAGRQRGLALAVTGAALLLAAAAAAAAAGRRRRTRAIVSWRGHRAELRFGG